MKLRLILNTIVPLLLLTLLSPWAFSQPSAETDRSGVLIMAHGGSEDWNRAVEAVVEPLREHYPVEIAFGMAKTSTLKAAVERLEAQGVDRIAVVRMFISGSSFLDKTEYILGLRESLGGEAGHSMPAVTAPHTAPDTSPQKAPHGSPKKMPKGKPHTPGMKGMPGTHAKEAGEGHGKMDMSEGMGGSMMMEPPVPLESDATFFISTKGVGESPLIDDILLARVEALSIEPSTEAIMILAHGPGDDAENKQWLIDMERRADRLSELGPFVEIRCETLREDWPGRRAEAEKRIRAFVKAQDEAGVRVLVVPFRVAGFGPYGEVLEGLDYTADGLGFSPHPNMTRWLDQTARAILPSLPGAGLDQPTPHAN